jgi:hypothetical protein
MKVFACLFLIVLAARASEDVFADLRSDDFGNTLAKTIEL